MVFTYYGIYYLTYCLSSFAFDMFSSFKVFPTIKESSGLCVLIAIIYYRVYSSYLLPILNHFSTFF